MRIWNLEGWGNGIWKGEKWNLKGWEYEIWIMEGREYKIWKGIWKGENMKSWRVRIWNLEGWEYEIWKGENMKVAIREAHLLQLQLPLLHSRSNILNFLSNLKHSEQTFILRKMSKNNNFVNWDKRTKCRIMWNTFEKCDISKLIWIHFHDCKMLFVTPIGLQWLKTLRIFFLQ